MAILPQLSTCPYCNAQLPSTESFACPRCGEILRRHDAQSQADAASNAKPTLTGPASTPLFIKLAIASIAVFLISGLLKLTLTENNAVQRGFPFMALLSAMGLVASAWLWFLATRKNNRSLGLFILANMFGMALLVLPLALISQDLRRANDPKSLPKLADPEKRVTPVPASLLSGLGWLPDDISLVAGIHVAELLAEPEGAKLLSGVSKNGQQGWLIDQGLNQVQKLTGLKPEAIDHLVLGLRYAGLPEMWLVVRTREDFDSGLLAKALTPVVAVKPDFYQLSKPPGAVARVDPRTIVVVLGLLAGGEKTILTEKPRIGEEVCPLPLRDLVRQRIKNGIQIWWAATNLDAELGGVMPPLPLGENDPRIAKLRSKIKSIAVGLRIDKDSRLEGSVECADAATARELAAALKDQKRKEGEVLVVAGPEPGSNDGWTSFSLRTVPRASWL